MQKFFLSLHKKQDETFIFNEIFLYSDPEKPVQVQKTGSGLKNWFRFKKPVQVQKIGSYSKKPVQVQFMCFAEKLYSSITFILEYKFYTRV